MSSEAAAELRSATADVISLLDVPVGLLVAKADREHVGACRDAPGRSATCW